MRKTRKCAFCGKEFTCNSGSQKYCSEHCAESAKAQRKKKQQDFIKAVGPVIDIASQEYLTFQRLPSSWDVRASTFTNWLTKENSQHLASAVEWYSSARQTSNRCWLAIPTIECYLGLLKTK